MLAAAWVWPAARGQAQPTDQTPPSVATQPTDRTDGTPPRGADALAQRQRELHDRLDALEQRMARLAKLLGEDEPAKAEKLRDALEESRELRLAHRLHELAELLRSAQFGEAERRQDAVIADLEAVLTVLTETLSDLDRKRQQREQLEVLRREVRRLLEEQSDHLMRTRDVRAAAERAAALDRLIAELEALAAAQGRLRESGADGPRAAARDEARRAARRAEQQSLEDRVRAQAAELRRLASDDAGPSALPPPDDPLAQAADEAESAAQAMRAAGGAMESGRDADEADAQRQAEERLRRAVERLRRERETLAQRGDLRDLESTQRELGRRTGELEGQMKEAGPDAQRTPGRRNVAEARQQMQRAADRMGEQAPQEAQQAQESAVDQLAQAVDALEDALRQMRREEMEETLAALEARFRQMLARQEEIRAATTDLALKGAEHWQRIDRLRLTDAAQKQQENAGSARAVERIVVQEGTTVILPELVGQLADDLEQVARLLDAADVGPRTSTLIEGAIDVLREIIAAIETQRDELQTPSDEHEPPGSQSGQPQPLLPGSAELKLLRSRQLGVNRQTEALAQPEAPGDPAGRADAFQRLTERQRALADLARKMNRKD